MTYPPKHLHELLEMLLKQRNEQYEVIDNLAKEQKRVADEWVIEELKQFKKWRMGK